MSTIATPISSVMPMRRTTRSLTCASKRRTKTRTCTSWRVTTGATRTMSSRRRSGGTSASTARTKYRLIVLLLSQHSSSDETVQTSTALGAWFSVDILYVQTEIAPDSNHRYKWHAHACSTVCICSKNRNQKRDPALFNRPKPKISRPIPNTIKRKCVRS